MSSIAAQTLARPGWAGSGLASEPWWRNAVFYRIDVDHFQDSDGDGTGDLPGIAQRLDYLQSLGVDAIVIPPPADESAFNNLLREAGNHRVRIIIAFDSQTSAAEVLGKARLWLTRGAAGVSVDPSLLAPVSGTNTTPPSLRDLRTLTDSFPGGRVLLAPATQTASAELITFPLNVASAPADFAANLRRTQLALQSPPATGTPLLESDSGTRTASALGADAARGIGLQKIVAVQLFASRGAVSLLYGQEIGTTSAQPVTMAWTPSNITPPKPEPAPEETEVKPATPAPSPPDPGVYGSFKPYVQPRPAPKPKPADAPVDPNTLPGFTAGKLPPNENPAHATTNVAVEDADPKSLLNFYRRLSELHHDNASLRSGTTTILDHEAEGALVWVRHAPSGSRTVGNVIVTCNLSDKLLTLSLDTDLTKLHIHTGTLRPLAASWTAIPIAQYSNHIVVPPYSVYIGELYR